MWEGGRLRSLGSGLQLNVGRKEDQLLRHFEQIDERKYVYVTLPGQLGSYSEGVSGRAC
jgi:hypothetical protein